MRCFAESVLIFHKETKMLETVGTSDLTREEFLEYTKNVWYIPAEPRRRGHGRRCQNDTSCQQRTICLQLPSLVSSRL